MDLYILGDYLGCHLQVVTWNVLGFCPLFTPGVCRNVAFAQALYSPSHDAHATLHPFSERISAISAQDDNHGCHLQVVTWNALGWLLSRACAPKQKQTIV